MKNYSEYTYATGKVYKRYTHDLICGIRMILMRYPGQLFVVLDPTLLLGLVVARRWLLFCWTIASAVCRIVTRLFTTLISSSCRYQNRPGVNKVLDLKNFTWGCKHPQDTMLHHCLPVAGNTQLYTLFGIARRQSSLDSHHHTETPSCRCVAYAPFTSDHLPHRTFPLFGFSTTPSYETNFLMCAFVYIIQQMFR